MNPAADNPYLFEGRSREELLDEIRRLATKLQEQQNERRESAHRRIYFGLFTTRVGMRTFAGSQLYSAATTGWDAWSAWLRSGTTSRAWPEAETRDLAAALLARFTRIGLFAVLFAALPLVMVLVQVIILAHQNALINQQSELAEAARRSALVFEQTAILDEIDEEIDFLETNRQGGDSAMERLSPRLEGRIIALSKSLRPYRYLDGQELIARAQSPERGQMLLALLNSKIDLSAILSGADLTFADLPGVSLLGFSLGGLPPIQRRTAYGVPRSGAASTRLKGANFRAASLIFGSFAHSVLDSANFQDAYLFDVDFSYADLSDARFAGAQISDTNFDGATLLRADFRGADIRNSSFSPVSIYLADFRDSRLTELSIVDMDVTRTWEIEALALCSAHSISAPNFPPALIAEMKNDKACARKISDGG
ncbi:MAG TPA: pentapeptide repeat-containing protein [Longimicrobium sp.]|jgi:uncharacterized protein YjbI with pentapeptide repeats